MTPEQAAAWIISQTACACAELAAMEVANDVQRRLGMMPIYEPKHFREVPDRYQIGCNDVARTFQEANR